MKDLKIGAACMKESGIRIQERWGAVPFAYQLVVLCTVRSIDFVTFQFHLNFGSIDSISEIQFIK